MKFVRIEAEYKLKEMLTALEDTRSSWRALVYHFSAYKGQVKIGDLHNITFSIINNELSDKDGSIFFLADNDVVIICNSAPKKTFDKITDEIKLHMPELALQNSSVSLSTTHDLTISWEEMNTFVVGKINRMEAKLETHGHTKATSVDEVAQQTQAVSAAAGSKDSFSRRAERKKAVVLLVEDDPLSLHLAKKALAADYTIVTAIDGLSARNAYSLHAPDIVFLDIGLPDISGQQLLTDLLRTDPTAYVVMLSANSTREAIMKAMQNGAKGFVGKPFSRGKLVHYIEQAPTPTHRNK